MWFWVWTLLGVGTLVGAFFLARDLWHKAKGLMGELARASEVVGQASERIGEAAARAAETPAPLPTLFDDVTVHYERVAAQRAARGERRTARRARNEATWQKWKQFND
ncbi:hypothetical protein [Antribacter gilvus]|uniref:hypothetical protein n=1 Tax=Antribacter gilvus TaxID=2304675 RepID=UPI000F7B0746|nr:hypothetical protein [Antribacter gilvus]